MMCSIMRLFFFVTNQRRKTGAGLSRLAGCQPAESRGPHDFQVFLFPRILRMPATNVTIRGSKNPARYES
jgi:hypothetical protein